MARAYILCHIQRGQAFCPVSKSVNGGNYGLDSSDGRRSLRRHGSHQLRVGWNL